MPISAQFSVVFILRSIITSKAGFCDVFTETDFCKFLRFDEL